jgi:hypothetical protein
LVVRADSHLAGAVRANHEPPIGHGRTNFVYFKFYFEYIDTEYY